MGKQSRRLREIRAQIDPEKVEDPDPERALCYRIDISGARDYPAELALSSEGFTNRMAKQHGDPDLWRVERISPDELAMRMIRAL